MSAFDQFLHTVQEVARELRDAGELSEAALLRVERIAARARRRSSSA